MVASRVNRCLNVLMEHTPEAWDPVDTVRRRVKELRGRKDWTGAELGKRLTELGVPWDRSIVANFENGRRRTVSVQELFALALVFDVAPVHLVIPLDDRPYRITPTRTEPSLETRDWFRGGRPLPGTDLRTFFSEVPLADIDGGMRRRRPAEVRDLGPGFNGSIADWSRAKKQEQQEEGESE